MTWNNIKLFDDPKHEAFFWPGGRPAALLVHGFPGTPAEMRPLARLLQPMGWTTQGLLLPGFGAGFSTVGEQRYEDWLAAVVRALAGLRARYRPVLLVGFSLGGALALCAAGMSPPDGLVLLAPFTWQGRRFYRAGSTLAPLLPSTFRPFAGANLQDPRLRATLLAALPGLDLEDPQVQMAVRELSLPVSVIRQIFRTGWRGYQRAADLRMPALVIQGTQDDTVLPGRTRSLARRLPNLYRYLEVDSTHRLMGEANLAWPTVQEAVMDFAAYVERQTS